MCVALDLHLAGAKDGEGRRRWFVRLTIREQIEKALRIDLANKAEVYSGLYQSAEITSLSYWLEVALSAGIATLGLAQNSPAVIIGGMLISPLNRAVICHANWKDEDGGCKERADRAQSSSARHAGARARENRRGARCLNA
jgi:hypothetical protein